MSVYYVTHPNIDFSATVRAPTTEKARTVFLDYLERQGAIGRTHRGYFREDMVAEKISSPESVRSDIELDYGYQTKEVPWFLGGGRSEEEEPRGVPVPGRILPTTEERLEIDRGLQESEREFPRSHGLGLEEEEEEKEEQQPKLGMPIQQIATRGFTR